MHRKQYRNPSGALRPLTASLLIATRDEHLERTLTEIVEARVSLLPDGDEFELVDGLHHGLQMVYTTVQVEEAVEAGGFDEYFTSSAGQFAVKVVEGYRLIGAEAHAELVGSAVATFIRRQRYLLFGGRSEVERAGLSYAALDDAFLDLEPASRLRVDYVRSKIRDLIEEEAPIAS